MSLADRVTVWLLRAARWLSVLERRRWVDAMIAELSAIPSRRARLRFAASGACAIVLDSILLRIHRWMRDRTVWGAAVATGLVVGIVDVASATRWPLRILLALAAVAFAWSRPVAAWRWGLALAAGVPLLAFATGFDGPYSFDRADTLYMGPPAIVLTGLVGWLLRRRARAA